MERGATRVLLVEDNPGDVRLVEVMLREAGGEGLWLTVADCMTDALQCLQKGAIDLVLLDLVLPDGEGLANVRRIRASAPHLPLVVLSGLGDEELAIQALHVGAQDYLVKGHVDSHLLVRSIRYAIERFEQERLYRLVADNATDLVVLHSLEGDVQYVSPSSQAILGYNPEALDQTRFDHLVHPGDLDVMRSGWQATRSGQRSRVTHRRRRQGGAYVWVGTQLTPVLDAAGQLLQARSSSREISERIAFEEKLLHQAFHDGLTGLPNRNLFVDRLEKALHRSPLSVSTLAVLFLDLDNFKVVNDSLGHETGDRLLVAVGNRVRIGVRPGDTVARWGGDEFTVLLDGVTGLPEATGVAERIAELLKAPFVLDDHEIFVTVSIGIVVGAAEHEHSDDLLRAADLAMYRAKNSGKAGHQVYNPVMKSAVRNRLRLESDLHRALERREIQVHYQPIFRLDTGEVAGVEALARWYHPERGLVSPIDFIPVAEETGIIIPMGEWILDQACQQVKEWQRLFPGDPHLRVSVNLSARQVRHDGLVGSIARTLCRAGLDPGDLRLELTESALVRDLDLGAGTLNDLKSLGIELALDDFGTGYSSLTYLRRLPIDILKVDKSFVKGLGSEAEDAAIVQATIALAKTLGLSVCGEGVETEEQWAQLQRMGCDLGQGYFFARPMPSEAFTLMLQRRLEREPVRGGAWPGLSHTP